jgi:uncharacterized protein (TIGR03437 family)
MMFTAGMHSISAHYEGSSNYLPSSSGTLDLTVDKASSTLIMSSNPAQLNQAVAIRAAPVLAIPAFAAGTVDFTNGGVAIAGCTSVPVGSGVAVCNTKFPQLGTFTITASYSGDLNVKPSTANLPLTVAKVVASVYTASAPATPVFGAPVTVNALLLGADGDPTPTGTVMFFDASAALGSLPVGPDGRASLVMPSASLATLNAGPHSFMATYSGDANYQSSRAAPLNIVVAKAATLLALASTPPQIGQPLTLKAAVTLPPSGIGATGGSLDFNIGGKAIAACTGIRPQNGIATCQIALPQLGNYIVGASYSGDTNTEPSTAGMQLTVGKAVAGVYTAAAPALPVFGSPVAVNALVLGAVGVPDPTGTVTFSDGADLQATIPLGGDGRASFVPASNGRGPLGVGPHSFVAIYNGDSNYSSSTAPTLKLTVDKAGTSLVLPASFGALFTATLTVLPPGTGTPTGTVQFFQSGALIGTAPLVQTGSGLVATLPATSQSGSIWAIYQGDANFSASTSLPVAVSSRAQITISARDPATAGQATTFIIQVSGNPGTGIPSGSVLLSVDGVAVGTATLSGGQVTLSTTLAAGSHMITATYSGDAVFPAASASIQQLVSKSVTALSLTSSASTTVYGQLVTFTAQGASPAGTVQFLDGSAEIGAAQASDGVATLVTANLSAGTHTITAVLAGVSNSAAVQQTVNKASTSAALTLSGLTLNVAVNAISPGAGTPSGTVTFMQAGSGTAFDAATLAGGRGSAPLSSIVNPILAVYSGDGNFQSSISSTLVPLAAVNAASYTAANFAPDEIVTLFASDLAKATVSATGSPSTSLGGITITVADSAGAKHPVEMLYVSQAQASFIVPGDTPPGAATITVSGATQTPLSTAVAIRPVAPGIFTLNGNGQGAPAGQVIRVHADGTKDAPQDLGMFDRVQNRWVPTPVDFGAPTDTLYLVLYGTGFRHYSATPVCVIADLPFPVLFAGPQGGFAGLDQINVLLPQSLRGMGSVQARLMADNTPSAGVSLIFQ